MLALLRFVPPPAAVAQGGGRPFNVLEVGAGATVVAARSTFSGVELGIARRVGAGLTRLALGAAGGTYEGRAGMRLAATAQFLLRPMGQTGAGPYGGLGVAFAGAAGTHGAEYLVLVAGVEAAPGRRQGWYCELGLAGGVRAVAGWRWRRFPEWWR